MKALKPSAVMARSALSVYVVDAAEGLAELYTLFLKEKGYVVRAYDQRAEALAALMADTTRPELLIMDCLGDSMPVDLFLQRCLIAHPTLRILIASESNQRDVMPFCSKPFRFIQKPFTADEFLQEVEAALDRPGVAGDPPRAHELFSVVQVRVNQSALGRIF